MVKQRLIASLIKHYKPKKPLRIIDVGCGNGSLLRQLERAFPTAVLAGIDGYAQALSHCRKRSTHATLIQEDILHLERLPASEPFDVAILADVLEHCDEPERVLRGVRSILAKDGIVIATVPASMLLWSDRDVFLGHRKRYNRSEFEALFRESGLQVLRSNYAFFYLYIPAFFFRKILAPFTRRSGQ
ncbi:class I SAM-dependent methyltransferase, partial [Candidatus Peregrinibacteria bacterium]|nr:class I SAM-dependent methyltransferase [Candidatus Peregrinibacteria bacterium]